MIFCLYLFGGFFASIWMWAYVHKRITVSDLGFIFGLILVWPFFLLAMLIVHWDRVLWEKKVISGFFSEEESSLARNFLKGIKLDDGQHIQFISEERGSEKFSLDEASDELIVQAANEIIERLPYMRQTFS